MGERLDRWILTRAINHFLKGKAMAAILEALKGKKTYIMGGLSILMSLASLFGFGIPGVPAIGHDAAVQTIVTALLGVFIRNGVANAPAK